MSLAELVQSSGWKNFIAKLYGIGASVVIIGALFKIQHWPLASIMLTAGLLTEAIIFFFSALSRFMKRSTGHWYILNLPVYLKKEKSFLHTDQANSVILFPGDSPEEVMAAAAAPDQQHWLNSMKCLRKLRSHLTCSRNLAAG